MFVCPLGGKSPGGGRAEGKRGEDGVNIQTRRRGRQSFNRPATAERTGRGKMRVIGVIDVMGGVVVRGVGGRRSEYRPVASSLCASAAPLDVAEAFRRECGIGELYLADLEAI